MYWIDDSREGLPNDGLSEEIDEYTFLKLETKYEQQPLDSAPSYYRELQSDQPK